MEPPNSTVLKGAETKSCGDYGCCCSDKGRCSRKGGRGRYLTAGPIPGCCRHDQHAQTTSPSLPQLVGNRRRLTVEGGSNGSWRVNSGRKGKIDRALLPPQLQPIFFGSNGSCMSRNRQPPQSTEPSVRTCQFSMHCATFVWRIVTAAHEVQARPLRDVLHRCSCEAGGTHWGLGTRQQEKCGPEEEGEGWEEHQSLTQRPQDRPSIAHQPHNGYSPLIDGGVGGPEGERALISVQILLKLRGSC